MLDTVVRLVLVPLVLGFVAAATVSHTSREIYLAIGAAPFIASLLRLWIDDIPFGWILSTGASGIVTVLVSAIVSVIGGYLCQGIKDRYGLLRARRP